MTIGDIKIGVCSYKLNNFKLFFYFTHSLTVLVSWLISLRVWLSHTAACFLLLYKRKICIIWMDIIVSTCTAHFNANFNFRILYTAPLAMLCWLAGTICAEAQQTRGSAQRPLKQKCASPQQRSGVNVFECNLVSPCKQQHVPIKNVES